MVVELSSAFVQTMEVMDFLSYKAVRCDFDFYLLSNGMDLFAAEGNLKSDSGRCVR